MKMKNTVTSRAPLVSIVVPIYRVEKYIRQCIDSILAQTLDAIEVILVDDGSPDSCGEIADEYAKHDSRVTVLHQSNKGLGPARNLGMSAARGEYIGFVDSDDWINSQMYELLYHAAVSNDADVVFTGFRAVHNGQVIYLKPQPLGESILNGQEEIFQLRRAFYGALPSKEDDDSTPISVWVGLYKRELLQSKRIQFRNIRSEDKFFNTEVCRSVQRVVTIGGTPYSYRKDDQFSITASFSVAAIGSYNELFTALFELALQESDTYKQECLLRTKRCVIDYSRLLTGKICNSDISTIEKLSRIKSVFTLAPVVSAAKGFPYKSLSVKQRAFYYCTRHRLALLALLLNDINHWLKTRV